MGARGTIRVAADQGESGSRVSGRAPAVDRAVAAALAGLSEAGVRAREAERRGAIAGLPSEPPDNSSESRGGSHGRRADADRRGLAARFHAADVHARFRPCGAAAATGFDALERLRVEALGAEWLPGIAANLARDLAADQATDAFWQPLLATVRTRLLVPSGDEGPADVGSPGASTIHGLVAHRHDQASYAPLARQLATAWLADRADGTSRRHALVDAEPADAPAAADDLQDDDAGIFVASDDEQAPGGAESAVAFGVPDPDMPNADASPSASRVGRTRESVATTIHDGAARDYRVYTRVYDEERDARTLAAGADLVALGQRLDRHVATQERVLRRLARAFARRLQARRAHAARRDVDEGMLDTHRLARLITAPRSAAIFREQEPRPARSTVVALLVDNSRSMHGRPILAAAAAADIVSRALERAGVAVEVLGYTTTSLAGGAARAVWESAGSPAYPGRLNALRHIVYKSAGESCRGARSRLGLMLQSSLLQQNVDGEALLWAAGRLRRRVADRRILLVVADGVPLDIATVAANDDGYLERHLARVTRHLERDRTLELAAIGIGHDVHRFYRRAIRVEDVRQLGTAMIGELDRLFERYDAT